MAAKGQRPPSDRQLAYLRDLGYRGADPPTSAEASRLIDAMKADGGLRQQRQTIDDTIGLIRQNPDYIGVRVQRHYECAGSAGWRVAFVPTSVVLQHPELLPPYPGTCSSSQCTCWVDAVDALEDLPSGSRVFLGLDETTTFSQWRQSQRPAGPAKTGGCVVLIVLTCVSLAAVGLHFGGRRRPNAPHLRAVSAAPRAAAASGDTQEQDLRAALAYLDDASALPDVAWWAVHGNEVMIGFTEWPADGEMILKGAALRGNKAIDFGCHAYGVRATDTAARMDGRIDRIYGTATARYGRIER